MSTPLLGLVEVDIIGRGGVGVVRNCVPLTSGDKGCRGGVPVSVRGADLAFLAGFGIHDFLVFCSSASSSRKSWQPRQ